MMNKTPEERKTMPLTNKEYYAFRNIYGMVNSFNEGIDILHARCNMIPGGWRDLKMVGAVSATLLQKLMYTIEPNKLRSMRKDLDHIVCEVRVAYDYAKRDDLEFTYCPTEAIDRLVNRVIDWECLSCDKCAKESKKCPVFKDINACYPWELPPNGEQCPLSGMVGD